MNSTSRPLSLKRRKFFGVGAASLGGILAAAGILPGLFRAGRGSGERAPLVTVKTNPLAVPRSPKGPNTNG
jgi:hypothetical protein